MANKLKWLGSPMLFLFLMHAFMVHSIAGGAHSSHSLSWKHTVRAAGWGGNLLFTARKDTLYHTDLQLLTWRLNSKGNLLYLFPFKPTKKQYLPCYKMERAIFYIAGVNYGRLCDLSSYYSLPILLCQCCQQNPQAASKHLCSVRKRRQLVVLRGWAERSRFLI